MAKVISFIIPAYNSQKFLQKGISTLLAPGVLDDLEVIIVNDGSTDATLSIAASFCEAYPETVRMISQENKGHGGALNAGCAAAVGKYLKIIDADDWVETENLPEYIRQLQACSSDVVLTHHHTVDISNGEIKNWKSYPPEFGISYNFDQIMSQWKNFDRSLTFHGITYRTDFYQKYGIQLSEHVFYEDHQFATIPCCYAKTITPLDLFIYDYRIGDIAQSVSDINQLKRLPDIETVLRRLTKEFHQLKLPENCTGRIYYCMKIQGLLLSYIKTVLLVKKNKKDGRKLAKSMMEYIRQLVPMAYNLAARQYRAFMLMSYFHITPKTWKAILDSHIYNTLRHNHDFQ